MADHFAELKRQPAFDGHPLKRRIDVPEAEVALVVLLPLPMVGIHLLSIDPI
ncbi:MAG: hypothetical protein M3P85_07780 [Actinomycetota bacterium]|nr:hypothetical protein [Actinomycetota bacterium]